MTPESHGQIQAIFEAAVDLAASERGAYISQACGGDAWMIAKVQQLMEADDETVTFGGILDQRRAPSQVSIKECSRCRRCFDDSFASCPEDGSPLETTMPGPLLVGGKYRIERSLGKGGMGAVYLAKHILLQKYFALKVISTDGPIPESFRKNFENEALALGRLKHPNIVEVTDYGVDERAGGLPYLVMEYLEGRSLREVIKKRDFIPFPDAVGLLRPIAAAIDCAHAQNTIHGDLKPANLFLARQPDGSEILKVVDFGLAQLVSGEPRGGAAGEKSDRSTVSDAIRGTPAYMAPELFSAQGLTRESDLFAFGVVTYEVLAGEQPFGKSIAQVQGKHGQPTKEPSHCNPAIPVELDLPVLSLLDRIPERRPLSASASVLEMEAAWLSSEQRLWKRSELPKRYLLALGVAAMAILIAGWLASWRVIRILEARTADSRFAVVPKHPADPRILVVTLDDEAIAEDSRRHLPEWDGKFAELMERILGGGARAVALDFLPPPSWSESQSFARVIETHPERIALALFSQSGKVVGAECLGTLTQGILGPERYVAMFGFANLEEDEDRRMRRERLFFSDRDGNLRPSLASRATRAAALWPSAVKTADRAIWIDYSVSPKAIANISWKAAESKPPEFFANKLVILGADFAGGTDRHRVPATADPDWVSGSVIQAMIANTITEDLPVGEVSLLACLGGMSLACFAAIALTLRIPHQPSWAIFLGAGAFMGYALLGFGMFRASRTMLVLVAPEIALLLSILAAFYLRSRLAPYPVRGV